MKNRLFIRFRFFIVAAVFFALSSPLCWSIENRAIMNPAGSSTVPPSSIQSGLIINRNPIDTSGNLVITGNVRRGRHFRDTVPYDSTTSLRTGLGSSSLSSFSLSSFLRDSAGAEDFGRSVGKYGVQPYYSRSQTVTTTRPGYSGVLGPVNTRANDRTLQGRYSAGMHGIGLEKQSLSGEDASTQAGTSWESSGFGLQEPRTQYGTSAKPVQIVKSIRELQLLTQAEAGKSPQDQQLMVERYQEQTQEARLKTQDFGLKTQDLRLKTQEARLKTQDPGTALEQGFVVWSPEHKRRQVAEIVQSARPDFSADVLTPALTRLQADATVKDLVFQDEPALPKVAGWEPQADEGKLDEHGRDLQGQRDRSGSNVLERIKQQIDDLTRSVDARLEAEADGREESRFGFPETPKPVRSEPFWWTGGSSVRTSNWANRGSYREKSSPLDELNKLSRADLSAKAKRIRGPHTSAGTFSEAKFNQHFQAAQGYLKAGRYYAAADSFALASIYKLDEPLCFAGRGHALLAAGEYISSALFLSRALEIAPGYVRTKIDLANMLGGENKLESRIAEIKEWAGKSNSGKLEFLLGYVYYRMGRLNQAKQAIEAAYEKMPNSSAVGVVKKAVEDAIVGR